MTSDLQSLLERIERAEGSDRELDAAIGKVFGWRYVKLCDQWTNPDKVFAVLPPFTASLDAALALVERLSRNRPMLSVWVILNQALRRVSDRHNRIVGSEITAQEITLEALSCLLRALTPEGEKA